MARDMRTMMPPSQRTWGGHLDDPIRFIKQNKLQSKQCLVVDARGTVMDDAPRCSMRNSRRLGMGKASPRWTR
jgi:hypothetical protein